MSLRYAILGYLSTAPGSGYDLAQQFADGLGWFWSASHSQIYPELRRLEEAGLIEGEATPVGERLEKRVYSITGAGRAEVDAWAVAPVRYRPNRDPERLQLIFADGAQLDDLRRHLRAHRRHFAGRRDQLAATLESIRAHRHERIELRYQGRSPADQALTMLLRELAYEGDVQRAEFEIRWADDALSRIDSYERLFATAAAAERSRAGEQ